MLRWNMVSKWHKIKYRLVISHHQSVRRVMSSPVGNKKEINQAPLFVIGKQVLLYNYVENPTIPFEE